MDIYEPIRELLLFMCKEDQPTETLDKQCGIKSTCYPPSQMYPEGHKIDYPFPIKPNDINFYNYAKSE